jgi:hypothetical protein
MPDIKKLTIRSTKLQLIERCKTLGIVITKNNTKKQLLEFINKPIVVGPADEMTLLENELKSLQVSDDVKLIINPPENVSRLANPKVKLIEEKDDNNPSNVNRLKERLTQRKINHELQIMQISTLKGAHVYCVTNDITSQRYGILLEKFICVKFNYTKNKTEDCNGDLSKGGKTSEIKVSLGGVNNNKYNFVQIRPSHNVQSYILTAYHLCHENVESEGCLYIFKISKSDMLQLIVSYGGYAHGTVKVHGKITADSVNDKKNTKEYAIRPTINDACWQALLRFRISESEL